MRDLGILKEVAVSDENSKFFQTQNKAAIIWLSSCGEDLWFFDLGGSLRIALI